MYTTLVILILIKFIIGKTLLLKLISTIFVDIENHIIEKISKIFKIINYSLILIVTIFIVYMNYTFIDNQQCLKEYHEHAKTFIFVYSKDFNIVSSPYEFGSKEYDKWQENYLRYMHMKNWGKSDFKFHKEKEAEELFKKCKFIEDNILEKYPWMKYFL